jgi:hypothetical protein
MILRLTIEMKTLGTTYRIIRPVIFDKGEAALQADVANAAIPGELVFEISLTEAGTVKKGQKRAASLNFALEWIQTIIKPHGFPGETRQMAKDPKSLHPSRK